MKNSLRSLTPNSSAAVGMAAGLALAAGWMWVNRPRARRYADRAADRRDPMSLFLPVAYPGRRAIDRSGRHPLFERRQSVYEAY